MGVIRSVIAADGFTGLWKGAMPGLVGHADWWMLCLCLGLIFFGSANTCINCLPFMVPLPYIYIGTTTSPIATRGLGKTTMHPTAKLFSVSVSAYLAQM